MGRQEQILFALRFAQRQVRRLIGTYPDFYPLYTHSGRWKHDKPAWTHWCDGFLPGMMWLFLESGQADDVGYWREKAENYSRALEGRKEDRAVHDLGFIFYHGSYKRWYEATVHDGKPEPALNEVVIRAGEVLAMRFQEKGQYLRSFISDESLFIDIMMNVPVIFYAARQLATSDKQLATHLNRIAHAHCTTTMPTLVRPDGSTAHEGIFDTDTGQFLRQSTQQGFSADSCWSRGLAWSLYGFAICYELTGEVVYLQTAQRNGEYYMANTPPDGVPPWDYNHVAALNPEPRTPNRGFLPDSSAAAIAASGLLDLARLTPDPRLSMRYRDYALMILNTLSQPEYLASEEANWEGILKHGVYHIHKNLGVDESVLWGDFFFVEALAKALHA